MAYNTSIVIDRAKTMIGENLRPSLSIPANSLTPSTITAMVGMAKGGALRVAPSVTEAITKIQSHAASVFSTGGGNAAILAAAGVSFSTPSIDVAGDIAKVTSAAANVGVTLSGATTSSMSEAMLAASNLQSLTSKMIPTGNPAAFGQLMMQAQSHISDAIDLKAATNFISNSSFSDYGDGVTDMKSMVTRGLDAKFGDLKSAASAFQAAGPAFDMSNMATFGTGAGLTNKLSEIKLGNASGINEMLTKTGVDLNNLTDPVYKDSITKSLSSVTDPKVIKTVVDQLGITLPSGVTTNSSLTTANPFAGAATEAGFNQGAVEGSITQGFSTASTAFGSGQVPTKVLSANSINNLNDLTDVKKLVSPDLLKPKLPNLAGIDVKTVLSAAGLSASIPKIAPSLGLKVDLPSMASKLSDMGAKFPSPSAAANMLKNIKAPALPNLNSTKSLTDLMAANAPDLSNLTGSGSGPMGVPSMTDFMQAVSGGPMISGLLAGGVNSTSLASIQSMVTNTKSLISKMGVDIDNDAPIKASLGSIMGFATSLHKIGADTSGSGAASVLESMCTADEYGDAIKASLAEGKNNALMMANNISAPVHTPNPPIPAATLPADRIAELEKEYNDYSTLIYNNEGLALKKHYAEILVEEKLPAMVDYYRSTNNIENEQLIEERKNTWANFIAATEAQLANGET